MRFVIAGGGVTGLAAALLLAREGHQAVVLERDAVDPQARVEDAFDSLRKGIPHFHQPHAFLPRGRRELMDTAPDVREWLLEAGAHEQDLRPSLRGAAEPGDEDLVYLWARRPVVEWALRRAASNEEAVELRSGIQVTGLETDSGRARGVATSEGVVTGDVVVDALGRYRPPAGWPRPDAQSTDCGAVYYCRYFRLAEGVDYPQGPWLLNPRGDLGYMGFNTFRGDNRTLAVILLAPSADRELRVLRHERAWNTACSLVPPLDTLLAPGAAHPITDVMPMGGLSNVLRTADAGVEALVALGDAFCHTDPAFSVGLCFSLVHARALAGSVADHGAADLAAAFRAEVYDESHERYTLILATDDARSRRWAGEPLDPTRRDGCYPLFSFGGALAAAPHDDHVLRRTVRRIGMLDRTAAFDADADLHARIEAILAEQGPPPAAGPPRDELLAALNGCAARSRARA